MKRTDCVKEINQITDNHVYFVNANNITDYKYIMNNVQGFKKITLDTFISDNNRFAFDYDINSPSEKTLLLGYDTNFKFIGGNELGQCITKIFNQRVKAPLVVLCYQSEKFIKELYEKNKTRYKERFMFIEGGSDDIFSVTFVAKKYKSAGDIENVKELIKILSDFNKKTLNYRCVSDLPCDYFKSSVIKTNFVNNAFDALNNDNKLHHAIKKTWLCESLWNDIYAKLKNKKNLNDLFEAEKIVYNNPEYNFTDTNINDPNYMGLLFIAFKLKPTSNKYLNYVIANTENYKDFLHNLYYKLFDFEYTDFSFWEMYKYRNDIVSKIRVYDLKDYNNYAIGKYNENALCYFLANTADEKKFFISFLSDYSCNYDINDLKKNFKVVFPDLNSYLYDFSFDKWTYLDKYYSKYKVLKLLNGKPDTDEEFLSMVNEQALSSDITKNIDPAQSVLKNNLKDKDYHTLVFFVDALNSEFLGYIKQWCRKNKLTCNIQYGICDLPSITTVNKIYDISDNQINIAGKRFDYKEENKLDELKHKGATLNYEKVRKPVYIINEFEIINDILNNIKMDIYSDNYQSVVLYSDHGSSRMVVNYDTDNILDVQEKAEHGGRCVKKSYLSEKPQTARIGYKQNEDYWCLASYDRFKGGKKPQYEAHGGATIEEMLVPVIEFTKLSDEIIVKMSPAEYKRKIKDNIICISINRSYKDVWIELDGKRYDAISSYNNLYRFNLENIKARKYVCDVYADNVLIKHDLEFIIESPHQNNDLGL